MLLASVISYCVVLGHSVLLLSCAEDAKWVGITLRNALKVCLILLDFTFKSIFWNQNEYQWSAVLWLWLQWPYNDLIDILMQCLDPCQLMTHCCSLHRQISPFVPLLRLMDFCPSNGCRILFSAGTDPSMTINIPERIIIWYIEQILICFAVIHHQEVLLKSVTLPVA